MPELPEIREHAARISASHRGKVLNRFTAISFTALKTFAPPPDIAFGEQLVGVSTRGKYLRMEFASASFVIHLMQGGRLTPAATPTAKPRGALCRWEFTDADSLVLTEAGKEHRAGVWVIAAAQFEQDSDTEPAPFVGLGPEADDVSPSELATLLTEAGGARLHGVLRDQRAIAGIGRRLANEICWAAQLSPFASCKRLDANQVERLHLAIDSCIEESLADERSRDHMAKSAQRISHVHHRTGQPCDRCGDTIREVSYNAYTVNYCATCQTAGKVLADNTTSKFLK